MSNGKPDPTGNPYPPGSPGGPPEPPQPAGAKAPERKGKYALVGPAGGDDWWNINDMEKMYAVVTVQASFPNAEKVIRFAWAEIPE